MEKCIRDGKVGILFADYGASSGWYTTHEKEELIFDPIVIEMVESKAIAEVIKKYCRNTYGTGSYDDAAHLEIKWIDVDAKFLIEREIDGWSAFESVTVCDEVEWMTA